MIEEEDKYLYIFLRINFSNSRTFESSRLETKNRAFLMDFFHPQNFFDLEKFPHKMLWEGETFTWQALEKLKSYLEKFPLGQIEIKIPKNVHLQNRSQISIGKGTVVEPGAYIRGPCIIGNDCIVRHGAYIRGFLITGNKCVIGHDTEIKNSILLDDVQAAHFAYVGDSVLGNRVNLGAGVKCANFRLDRKEISLIFNEERISTGLKKLGSILADDVQIGCNTVLNPGTFMGKKSLSHPCLSLHGFIPAKSIVKPSKGIVIESLREK